MEHHTHYTPAVRQRIAEAEQRGREDNADHGQCYVYGSRALEARIAEARAEGAREALLAAARSLPGFDGIRTHGDAARWLRNRAEQTGATP